MACLVLFGHKNVGKSLQNPYQTWQAAAKTLKKHHQTFPMETLKKRHKLFHRLLGEYTLFLIPLRFLNGGKG